MEGEDYEPIRRIEMEFDKGELEKHIIIKLIEKEIEEIEETEIYMVF